MRWLKIAIYILILYGIYGNKQLHFSSAKQENPHINEIRRVQLFLQKYDAPLQANAPDFIEAAIKYKVDYKVLVSIAGVESGFCKFPAPGTTYNCWGYRSYSSPSGWWRFASYREGIYKVAQTISTDRAYSQYQRSGSILDLAKVYTALPTDWTSKLEWFIKQI